MLVMTLSASSSLLSDRKWSASTRARAACSAAGLPSRCPSDVRSSCIAIGEAQSAASSSGGSVIAGATMLSSAVAMPNLGSVL